MSRLWPAEGTIDRLPEEAAALRALEGRLAAVLDAAGYLAHNAKALIAQGKVPALYIPKL